MNRFIALAGAFFVMSLPFAPVAKTYLPPPASASNWSSSKATTRPCKAAFSRPTPRRSANPPPAGAVTGRRSWAISRF